MYVPTSWSCLICDIFITVSIYLTCVCAFLYYLLINVITRTVTMATVVLSHRGHIFYMIAGPDNDTPVKLRGGHRS